MKIIGKTESTQEYICIVNHVEIEKFLNLYFGKLSTLKVGTTIDLGKGYDFYAKTQSALKKTEEFIEANKDTIDIILTGITINKNVEDQS